MKELDKFETTLSKSLFVRLYFVLCVYLLWASLFLGNVWIYGVANLLSGSTRENAVVAPFFGQVWINGVVGAFVGALWTSRQWRYVKTTKSNREAISYSRIAFWMVFLCLFFIVQPAFYVLILVFPEGYLIGPLSVIGSLFFLAFPVSFLAVAVLISNLSINKHTSDIALVRLLRQRNYTILGASTIAYVFIWVYSSIVARLY